MEQRKNSASTETLAALENQTGGWPAALRLVGAEPRETMVSLQERKIKEIYPYLAAEVLSGLPEERKKDLPVSSIIPGISTRATRDEKSVLLRRAGSLAYAAGEQEQALEYYLAAGFDHNLASILKEAGQQALL